jgi:hypothetical protein
VSIIAKETKKEVEDFTVLHMVSSIFRCPNEKYNDDNIILGLTCYDVKQVEKQRQKAKVQISFN